MHSLLRRCIWSRLILLLIIFLNYKVESISHQAHRGVILGYFILIFSLFLQLRFSDASIPLKNILRHSLFRLLACISVPSAFTSAQLICKYGADGSSGNSEYMHKLQSPNKEINDTNLSLLTFVSLRLGGTAISITTQSVKFYGKALDHVQLDCVGL